MMLSIFTYTIIIVKNESRATKIKKSLHRKHVEDIMEKNLCRNIEYINNIR